MTTGRNGLEYNGQWSGNVNKENNSQKSMAGDLV